MQLKMKIARIVSIFIRFDFRGCFEMHKLEVTQTIPI